MATSCIIGKKENNIVKCIKCRDGCLKHVGWLLNDHYKNPKKIDQLLELGDLETLGKSNECCSAYSRDKGEDYKDVKAQDVVFGNLPQYAMHKGANYVYLYDNEQWKYARVEIFDEFDEPEVDLYFNSLSNWCWHDNYQKFCNKNSTVSLYDMLTTFAM